MSGRTTETRRLVTHAHFLRAEARRCAGAGAYLAASVMIGAALEAVLLATLLEFGADELRAAGYWPTTKKGAPARGGPESWGLRELIEAAWLAGWLDIYEHFELDGENDAQVIRALRNYVHPERFVADESAKHIFTRQTYRELDSMVRNAFDASEEAREARAV